jgi:hypothetical protein
VVTFTPRPLYTPGTHWIEGWVGPRAGLDDMEKRKFLTLPRLEIRPLGLSARNQSVYRLRYPGSVQLQNEILVCKRRINTHRQIRLDIRRSSLRRKELEINRVLSSWMYRRLIGTYCVYHQALLAACFILWRAAKSRNSELNLVESFPRQRNETIASVAGQRVWLPRY